jgi:hypothetical protein
MEDSIGSPHAAQVTARHIWGGLRGLALATLICAFFATPAMCDSTQTRDAEAAELRSDLSLLNQSNLGQLISDIGIDGVTLGLDFDANVWDQLSGQDQRRTLAVIEKSWAHAYARYHAGAKPKLWLIVRDLSGEHILERSFQAISTAP